MSSVLLLYGLHPDDFEARVANAVDQIRPKLRKQGCEVELVSAGGGAIRLRVETGSHTCGSTAKTVQASLEGAMYDAAPDLTSLVIEGFEEKPASGFVALDKLMGGASVDSSPAPLEQRRRLDWECRDMGMQSMSSADFTPSGDGFGVLRQFARRERSPLERCELCSLELAPDHHHLIELAQRRLLCTCEACAILFSGQGVKFKRVPRRVALLPDFTLSDAEWDRLMVPINMAFFFKNSLENRVIAMYPSPGGAMESLWRWSRGTTSRHAIRSWRDGSRC